MKKLLIFTFFCLTTFAALANKIDSLKTDAQVKAFLSPLLAKKYYKGFGDNSQINTWQKTDLNGDKRTDLMATEVAGFQAFNYVVICKSDTSYQLLQINYSYENVYESIDLANIDNKPYVVFHGLMEPQGNARFPRTDTLTYKFDSFIELNDHPAHYQIKSIKFSTLGGWYGRNNTPPPNINPDNVLTIDNSRNAVYSSNRLSATYIFTNDVKRPPRNPKMDTGNFKGRINKVDLENLYNLIDYIGVKNLKDKYAVGHTDDVSCYVTIIFKDGTVKEIADYGGKGTFGLQAMWSKLYGIVNSTAWK